MKSTFRGFAPEALAFLTQLKNNNDREWFTPRKHIYEEQLRQPMIELVRALHGRMMEFAPQYVGEPAKCVFRIYRDTRFSKNKIPYKTNIAASFRHARSGKHEGAGYYFSISPDEIEAGGGIYMPSPETLLKVRQRIAGEHAEFRATFETAKVRRLMGELYGESAARAPKGFDAAHPAIDLLKRKQFCLFTSLDPKLATTPKLCGELVKRFEAITPFIEFLNAALSGTRQADW
jgi:uncharacterized protein (TIGR02453 family)